MDVPDIIFLDVGGTLLSVARPVGETYAHFAARHGVHADPAALTASFQTAFRRGLGEGGAQNRRWWRTVVDRTFRAAGGWSVTEEIFTEIHDHYRVGDAWRLLPGAREIGPALRSRGYRTGIISNWDERLPELLDRLGLSEGIDPLVVSAEVGSDKPEPEIFRTALDRAGTPPERALMVGDDPDADVRGALDAGLRAVLVHPGEGDPGVPFVRSLPGLLDLLPPRNGK